jgi:hypothetical protein
MAGYQELYFTGMKNSGIITGTVLVKSGTGIIDTITICENLTAIATINIYDNITNSGTLLFQTTSLPITGTPVTLILKRAISLGIYVEIVAGSPKLSIGYA